MQQPAALSPSGHGVCAGSAWDNLGELTRVDYDKIANLESIG